MADWNQLFGEASAEVIAAVLTVSARVPDFLPSKADICISFVQHATQAIWEKDQGVVVGKLVLLCLFNINGIRSNLRTVANILLASQYTYVGRRA